MYTRIVKVLGYCESYAEIHVYTAPGGVTPINSIERNCVQRVSQWTHFTGPFFLKFLPLSSTYSQCGLFNPPYHGVGVIAEIGGFTREEH